MSQSRLKKDSGKNIICFIILAAVSFVFLLLCSATTTPLNKTYYGDSLFFILVGQAMTKGMLPYTGFFERNTDRYAL